jgi:arginyl-tRNA synthetase
MKQKLKNALNNILKDLNLETNFELRQPPSEIKFDLSTNVLLQINKKFKKDIKEISNLIIKKMLENYPETFSEITFFPAGFINFNINKQFLSKELLRIIKEKNDYPIQTKKTKKVLIEFVSSNPTGPLHIGHGRCAVIGDVLANIFTKLGYEVYREYYVNDRGRQITNLVASVISMFKDNTKIPSWVKDVPKENFYKGDYLIPIANKIWDKYKDFATLEDKKDSLAKDIVDLVMQEIKFSLEKFNVKFDNYYSENSLYSTGEVEKVLKILEEKNLIELKDGALWFKSKDMGDDKDRVIKRSNGEPTYFLSDIAYHLTKLNRGYNWLINIWGTDHHGYVQRLTSAVKSVYEKDFDFDIILYQLVSLIKNGNRVSMSTREGKFVTLDEVVKEVGVDVTRYFLLTKTPNTHLDFDFDLAKEQSLKNPVYYIQYAHTRCSGILRESKVDVENFDDEKEILQNLAKIENEYELLLSKKICFYEDVLEECLEIMSPHLLCNYLLELSKIFHKFYENCRVIELNGETNLTRLSLVYITKTILHNGLTLLGLSSPEKM